MHLDLDVYFQKFCDSLTVTQKMTVLRSSIIDTAFELSLWILRLHRVRNFVQSDCVQDGYISGNLRHILWKEIIESGSWISKSGHMRGFDVRVETLLMFSLLNKFLPMNNAQTTSWQVEKEKHHREMKYMGRLERGSSWDVLKGNMLFKIYYKAEQSKAKLTINLGGILLKR